MKNFEGIIEELIPAPFYDRETSYHNSDSVIKQTVYLRAAVRSLITVIDMIDPLAENCDTRRDLLKAYNTVELITGQPWHELNYRR